MDVFEAIKKRKSVRSYLDKAVEEEKLSMLLEAARLSPSARNIQERRFIVVLDKKTRQKLMVAAKNQSFVGEAPVIIACCAIVTDYKMTCGQLAYPIDVAIAIDHMTLAAAELGLGSCWVGAFYEDQAKKVLGIPEDVCLVEMLAVGYPADSYPNEKNRLPLKEIVMREKWG
ncbi:MAG: nitroreductase family protein [Candidatus Saganbacteria bacterium]|nr:nitroreductase family protein [Candidatus Saganbacteria bacterium]